MAPLVVEGDTLGQKHRNYNKIVNETTQELIPEIDYEEPDLDNLFKIDIACKNRNVDYVIKVLQCEDMLYVSRAIKRSTWLITDPQYANIVNPNYLNDQLAPNMMTKAFNKLLLHVRLNLKDEERVEVFFTYYKDRNLQAAFKWLPNCSFKLTVTMIQKHAKEIPNHLLIRLCEKCITHVDISTYRFDHIVPELENTTILLRSNMEKYLDILETHKSHEMRRYGPKATKLIMKNCRDRVMKNIEIYLPFLHIPTFVKFVKQEDIKDFITTNIKNKNLRALFTHSKIKPFLNRLPVEERFEFVKEFFINKKQEGDHEDIVSHGYDCVIFEETYSPHTYLWYAYAPFDFAFMELKKLIHSESMSSERASMFAVMLTCAGKNIKNIHTVLKYYRENHMSEPFRFKIQFVNLVIINTNAHNFDKKTWGYLNDLFSNMDVYSESVKLQNAVRCVLLYKVINDESVPDIIEKKFLFDTFKKNQKNLSEEGKKKLFSYLYKYLTSKIDTRKINDKREFNETMEVMTNILRLLFDWNKELQDFPTILHQIKQIVQSNQENEWKEDISILYNVKKSWRKFLFAESIVLRPTQEVCINALKHGPELLETYKNEVEILCLNEYKPMNQFLKKIRIYWSKTLAKTYKDYFIKKKDQRNKHKAAIIGLCTLLQKNELSNLVKKYAPIDSKIDLSQADDVELNVRKHIASRMHVARPQPSPTAVLLYAKGDYLRFVLPSLHAIFYNLSTVHTREHLNLILSSPMTLRKHGIPIASVKFKLDELKNLFTDIWESSKNKNIRAAIFKQTFSIICKLNEPAAVRVIWELLSKFIDSLTHKENRSIYIKLSKAEKVPMCVRSEFWMKSYKLLNSLPPKTNCNGLLDHLTNCVHDLLEFLDDDIFAEIFLNSLDEDISTKYYESRYLLLNFVLATKTEESHVVRYNKIFVPILERSLALWYKSHEGTNYVRRNLNDMLLSWTFERDVLQKQMVLPIPMFTDVLKRLRENLPIDENYALITTRTLSLDCVKIFDRLLKTNEALASKLFQSTEDDNSDKYEPLYTETAPELGKLCVSYLREDVLNYFPSIYMNFATALKNTFNMFSFNTVHRMMALKPFLEYKDFIPGYQLVLEFLSNCEFNDYDIELKSELLNEISAHASKEIKMQYCGMLYSLRPSYEE